MNYKIKSWLYSFLLHGILFAVFLVSLVHFDQHIANNGSTLEAQVVFLRDFHIKELNTVKASHLIHNNQKKISFPSEDHKNSPFSLSRIRQDSQDMNLPKENKLFHQQLNSFLFSHVNRRNIVSNGYLSKHAFSLLKTQIMHCWNMPPDASFFPHAMIILGLDISHDRRVMRISILQEDGDSSFQESFKRSVLDIFRQPECSVLNLPINSYDIWHHIEIRFSPEGFM